MYLFYSNQIFQKISDIQIICIMQDEETDEKFVVYTNKKSDEQGDIMLYASIYDVNPLNENELILRSIYDERIWENIEKTINEILK